MKKIVKFLSAMTVVSSLLFAGCSMLDSASVSDSDYKPASDRITLSGNVMDSSGTARTITPVVDSQNYKYYITGKTNTGIQYIDAVDDTKKITEVTLSADGEFELPITSAAWELTLVAIDAAVTAPTDPDSITANAALVAYAYADLLKSNAPVTFTLTPNGLTGNGTVTLTLYLSNDSTAATAANLWELPDGYNASAEIQDIITGSPVSWSGGTGTYTGIDFGEVGGGITKKSKSTSTFGTTSQLDPGTYNFVVTFHKEGVPDTVWSDSLIILPKKDTERDVFIPNLLGLVPGDVTTFNAYWIEDSEDLPQRDGYYLTHFEWNAKTVVNERYFEIELGELAAACDTDDFSDDTKWNTNVSPFRLYAAEETDEPVVTGARVMKEVRKQAEYYTGSLLANNTYLTLYVPLGKALTARIRAVNNIGVSEHWTYVTLPKSYSVIPESTDATGGQVTGTAFKANLTSTLTNKEPKGFTDKSDGSGSNAASAINRFRITYNLNGGKYQTGTGPGSTKIYSTKNVVRYYNLYKFASAARLVRALWAASANGDYEPLVDTTGASFVNWSTQAVATNTSKVYKPVTTKTDADAAVGTAATIATTANVFKQTTDGQGGSDTTGIKLMRKLFFNADEITPLTTGKPTADAVEAKDDGGYIGFDNLYLWADYSASFDAGVSKEDFAADFAFCTDWVKIVSNATTGTIGTTGKFIGADTDGKIHSAAAADADKLETTGTITVSKDKEADSDKVELQFSIELPDPETGYWIKPDSTAKNYKLDPVTETAVATITIMDAQKRVYYATDNGVTLSGGTGVLGFFDVNSWENGAYTAYINLTSIKTKGRPVTTSVRITLNIQD